MARRRWHIEVWRCERLVDLGDHVATRAEAEAAATAAQAESDAWTAELQAGMEAGRVERLRGALCDDDPDDDGIPPVGRARAIRYTIRAAACDCGRRVRA